MLKKFFAICIFALVLTNGQNSTQLLSDLNTNIVQMSNTESYVYQVQSADVNAYVMFELRITEKPEGVDNFLPLFAARIGAPCEFIPSNGLSGSGPSITADKADYNAYYDERNYHYILFQPGDLTNGTNLYFCVINVVGTDTTRATFAYTLSMFDSEVQPCPDACSGFGTCVAGVCACSSNKIGETCGTDALRLTGDASAGVLAPRKWAYYYLMISDFNSIFEMDISKDPQNMLLSLKVDGLGYGDLPNRLQQMYQYLLGSSTNQAWKIMSSNFPPNTTTVLVGLFNPLVEGNVNYTLSVHNIADGSSAGTSFLGILIFVIILVIVLITYVIFFYFRYRYLQQQQLLARGSVPITLTQDEIQKYFPSKPRNEWNSNLDQPTCAICMEDFTPESTCVQMILCEHIYHSDCIYNWIKIKEICPSCNKEHTKPKMDEFLANGGRANPNNPANEVKSPQILVPDQEAQHLTPANPDKPASTLQLVNEGYPNTEENNPLTIDRVQQGDIHITSSRPNPEHPLLTAVVVAQPLQGDSPIDVSPPLKELKE